MIRTTTPADTTRRLLAAAERGWAVTVTYAKEDGTVAARTLEVHDARVSEQGAWLVTAVDRDKPGELRTWRADRITHLTVHRGSRFVCELPTEEPAGDHPTVALTLLAEAVSANRGEGEALWLLADLASDEADRAEARGLVGVADVAWEAAADLAWAAAVLAA